MSSIPWAMFQGMELPAENESVRRQFVIQNNRIV